MALRLRIISDHRRHLGDRSTKIFGPGGGTIGRSADNDWVLPDPLRYVSAHHARVRCQNGHYYLEDLSTNGVYVNDDPQPLGKRRTYRLRHGDVLRFGEYQVVVTLEAEEPPVFDDTGSAPAVPTSIQVLRGLGRAAQTDIGASLNLEQLLITESPPGEAFHAVDAYGQSVAVSAPSAVAARPAPTIRSEADDEAVARRLARLAKAAGAVGRESRTSTSTSGVHDVRSGLQAFCRGAGIDAEQFPVDAQARLLHLAGQLLRESLLGLKDLERARDGMRSRFGLGPSSDPDDPRPSLARSSIDELLTQIFRQHESRRLDAVQWLREALANARSHEEATVQAMRAAFVEFIGRLDPVELEARFDRAADRAKRAGEPVQYWDLYGDFFRNLTEMPADHLPHTFVEAFANAYLEWLKKPSH